MIDKNKLHLFWSDYKTVIVYGSITLLYCLFTVYLAGVMIESHSYRVIETENGTIRIPVNDSAECEYSMESELSESAKNSSACSFDDFPINLSKKDKRYNEQRENTNKIANTRKTSITS